MGELLLELLSEEIPARMQRRAIEEFGALVRAKLAAAEIPAETQRGYVTPRRLVVIADGIPGRQPDRSEERRGPRVGAPQPALDGFLRASGLQSIDQCEIRDTGRGEFYFAILQHKGRATAEILPELLREAIAELPWPTSMRFPASSLRWVRPLNSVICLFDGAVLPLPLDQIPVGRTTRGHRFLSDGEIAVDNAADYLDRLERAHVILDHDRRRALIAADLDRLAAAEGVTVKPDPALLDEVAGLVEYPVVLMGRIDEASMELPPEVLATAMRTHQKYFSCLNRDGSPAPRFLFVANNRTPDHGKTIIAGNERVLRARLADARFFWDQDRKMRLEDRVEALKQRVYHARLGSVRDKVRRMELISDFLAAHVPGADAERARRAAFLAKADLSTGMVAEFPELQGVMGRYYALHGGEDPRVADAIADHYRPLGPSDKCPTAPDSVVVALADKIDTLVAFFSINEKPTGSRDPFALRRATLGMMRIIFETELRISLRSLLVRPMDILDCRSDTVFVEVQSFISDRLRIYLRDQGLPHDVVAAVVRPGFERGEDDLVRLVTRVYALRSFLATEEGTNLSIAYRRASNILSIEEQNDGRAYTGLVNRRDLQLPEEAALATALDRVALQANSAIAREDFEQAMSALATLRQPVDEFFDKVTVNTDDPKLRENRLRLLSRIRAVMNQVADFSQIEG